MIEFSTSDLPDGGVELAIKGHLDAVTAPQLRDLVDELGTGSAPSVVVDLAGLDLIDSSGIAVLVALFKRTSARKAKMKICGARDQPLAILKLLNLDRVFTLEAGPGR